MASINELLPVKLDPVINGYIRRNQSFESDASFMYQTTGRVLPVVNLQRKISKQNILGTGYFWQRKFCIFYTENSASFTPKILYFFTPKILYFFTPKILYFLHWKLCIFTPKIMYFLHRKLCIFYTENFVFFTPQIIHFYTENFVFLHRKLCIFTPKILYLLHRKLCIFYTENLSYMLHRNICILYKNYALFLKFYIFISLIFFGNPIGIL